MNITVFAKKKTTHEGRDFYVYTTTMKRKDGSELAARVKFRKDCAIPKPEACPMNLVIEKINASLAKETYQTDMGEVKDSWTLWVSGWQQGEPYVDHSLDDFE